MRRKVALLAAAGTTVVAGGLALVTVPANAATGCQATYTVANQWSGGFRGDLTVTNLGDPLTSWTVAFTFPDAGQQVVQGWNGRWSQSGTAVTVANESWNGAVATNASTTLGFNGAFGSANPVPTGFTLNGTRCTGAVASGSSSASHSATASASSSTSSPGTPSSPSTSSASSSSSLLAQVNTAGRVRSSGSTAQYTWPGVYFEGRFHGTGVGVALNDANNDYVVQVDGATVANLVTPGKTTYWVNNLSNADHTVRLAKRTESPWAAGEFGGFVAASGGTILTKPTARSRQIEFIGDSWTAGYGNMSTTRDCSSNGGVTRNSNADSSFGAIAARSLNADYQLNAWSGLGMVRNYNGQNTETSFRAYYDTDLQAVWNATTWQNPGTWKPQVVVVGLGINDFSTTLNSGEKWSSIDALAADYRTAYLAFLDKLRSRYGSNTFIVLTYPDLSYTTTAFATSIQQIVKTRNDQGDTRVRALYYDDNALGLDKLGCDWHPSLHDDQILAATLSSFITALPLSW